MGLTDDRAEEPDLRKAVANEAAIAGVNENS